MSAVIRAVLSIFAVLWIFTRTDALAVQTIERVRVGSDVALVFVHGVGGSADSFTSDDVQHPQTGERIGWHHVIHELDGERELPGGRHLRNLDIYALDYSDAFAGETTIAEIAIQVGQHLALEDLIKSHNHVIFVAHSMGGLVLRRLFADYVSKGKARYLDRLAGVIYLGVPSEGAQMANLATSDWLLQEVAAYYIGANSRQLLDLRTVSAGNSLLLAIDIDWGRVLDGRRRSAYPFRAACAYETVSMVNAVGSLATVVPRLYTKTNCDGDPVGINKKHTELGVVTSASGDGSHDFLVQSVRAMLQAVEDASVQTWADGDGSLGDLLYEVRKQRLAKNVTPDDVSDLPLSEQTITLLDEMRVQRSRRSFRRPPKVHTTGPPGPRCWSRLRSATLALP